MLILLIVVFIAGIALMFVGEETFNDWMSFLGVPMVAVSMVALVLCGALTVCCHIEIYNFKGLKANYHALGASGGEYDRAAIANQALKANTWLYVRKDWNKGLLDDFIPDEINELEPIR